MVTLKQLLDLIDNCRESEEIICLMNSDGKIEAKAMVCSKIWKSLEDHTVNSIQAEDDMLKVWLNDLPKENEEEDKLCQCTMKTEI